MCAGLKGEDEFVQENKAVGGHLHVCYVLPPRRECIQRALTLEYITPKQFEAWTGEVGDLQPEKKSA